MMRKFKSLIIKLYGQYYSNNKRYDVFSRIKIAHPSQVVVFAFLVACLLGALLLMNPAASENNKSTPFVTALFTAVSAICVTGLSVVDTPTYWSTFGEVIIMVMIQIGGFGILTLAALLGLSISRRFGLRTRLATQVETSAVTLGDLPAVLKGVLFFTLIFEGLVATILSAHFVNAYGMPLNNAIYFGIFHAISSFNNAGFALFSDNMMQFVQDPVISLTLAFSTIAGGLGFPVLLDLFRRRQHSQKWLLHTKITVIATAALLIIGTSGTLLFEWSNPATLGPMATYEKILPSFFHSVQARTSGFNSLAIGSMDDPTLLLTNVLMFIGGGSASTAGGIKVTTFAVLAIVIYAEVRGRRDVHLFKRHIASEIQRQALSITLLSAVACFTGILLLLALTDFDLRAIMFETISAFGTVGLSTGITPLLSSAGQLVLIALMFIGRVGPVTIASALASNRRQRLYKLPEERPIVG